ncbi:DUF1405 domain-containing protein [Macrococcoides caseolyticum]|uniref:DUF1405 domain-containing protein n=1 Tax=Macrococcoides caseolyticum TaxID=69966 RepID=UPI001F36FCD3|nr:DUF1405 domain-containing protein [Macrococcus caseolyticus]MCE4957060.1 DUF1405 domain-containing protein [Macrococcus caseolyticus]
MSEQFYYWIQSKAFLTFIIICNVLGTIYGYYWYMGQLVDTEWYFIPFVPDSPTATLFLVIALTTILMKKHIPLIECLAFITLIKYGIWAVVMNIFTFIEMEQITAIGLMLCVSHGIMAIQALMFFPLFKIRLNHVLMTAVWVFHNDVIDYVYMQYPIYSMLSQYIRHIGYFSFWLSVFCFILLFLLNKKDETFD